MTPQEIFDNTLFKLRAQGMPALYGSSCLYRAANGNRCAVGHQIPDALYTPAMEGFRIDRLIGHYDFPDYFYDNLSLLSRMQSAHDNDYTHSSEAWEQSMEAISIEFGLHYTPAEEMV